MAYTPRHGSKVERLCLLLAEKPHTSRELADATGESITLVSGLLGLLMSRGKITRAGLNRSQGQQYVYQLADGSTPGLVAEPGKLVSPGASMNPSLLARRAPDDGQPIVAEAA